MSRSGSCRRGWPCAWRQVTGWSRALVAALLVASWVGCQNDTTPKGPASPSKGNEASSNSSATGTSTSGEAASGGTTDASNSKTADPAVEAELAKLAPDDRTAVVAQRTCPVSDELLGSMGPPIKLYIEGRPVWVCCDGCEESFKDDPAKFFAKMRGS